MKMLAQMYRWTNENRSNFLSHPHLDQIQEFLKGFSNTARKLFDKHQLIMTLRHRKFLPSSDWGSPQDPNWLRL